MVSNNQIFIVDFVPTKHLNIYKMDFDAIKRTKVDDLGDKANLPKWKKINKVYSKHNIIQNKSLSLQKWN